MVVSKAERVKVGTLVLLLVCVFGSGQTPAAAGQGLATCGFPFYASVYSGPHAGLVYSGTLQLAIEGSGATNAILQTDDGDSISAVGQVTGRTLAILFNLGNGTYISAIGTADNDVRDCHFGVIFGSLVGPDLDDSGSWGPAPSCMPYPACRLSPQ